MAKVFFDNPMTLTGTAEEKLRQVYSYLFTMSEKLNDALNTITIEQMLPEAQATISKASGAAEKQQSDYSALKAMIVKTATIVRSEMDEIGTQLHGEYQAISEDFGELEQNLDATITATASGIVQNYDFSEVIRANDEVAGLQEFKKRTSDYIFTGLIDADNNIVGVAIGENVTSTDEQGNESLNTAGQTATFTKNELAFYSNGQKVAWFAQNAFYIKTGKIENSLQMGENHKWQIMANGALALVALNPNA